MSKAKVPHPGGEKVADPRMRRRLFALPLMAALVLPLMSETADAAVQRKKYSNGSSYMIVEILDDDLVHVELSAVGTGPSTSQALYTSPMVLKTDYTGPQSFTDNGSVLETNALRLEINTSTLCLTAKDKTRQNAVLTTVCPAALTQAWKGIDISASSVQDAYGLGQEFKVLGSAEGDWTALGVREGLVQGNGFQGFQNAAVGNVQIPVLFAVGSGGLNFGLFMDNVYRQRWDFTSSTWQARMFGDQLRYYLMSGPNLPDLRSDYMELTGRPPVPPKKAFGLWVSEFGYDNWNEVDGLLSGLRADNFPVDGFVLDLNWFGGVVLNDPSKSQMGRLDWDQNQTSQLTNNSYFFPNPAAKIQQYDADHIALTAIEEAYLANTTNTFSQFPTNLSTYLRTNGVCSFTNQNTADTSVSGFWGVGRMIDWSDPAAGTWIHDQRRHPNLSQLGIHAHWTDLGEPETYNGAACYEGVETTVSGRKIEHSDIHNIYNLLWNKSIWDGYYSKRGIADNLGLVNPRPFIVTRSGAGGTQRFGASMWSGDIASNLQSLATHFNAHMHMAMAGIDYYGSDIGGFRREVMPYNNQQGAYRGYEGELYTQWFANGAWFDVPVRPHTDNEFITVNPPYKTSPHLVGKKDSNLANIRQRYELTPYYYSLAYRAYLAGEPLVPPPVFYYQNDPAVRQMGNQKMIGKDMMVGIVAAHGEYERDLYLPAGTWVNYHSNEWITSTGQTVAKLPTYRDGVFRLPAYARAGAIIPQMHVDANTKDVFGNRKNGAAARNELIVKVFADATQTSFTLYEDDGKTLTYTSGARPVYHHRTTAISQRQDSNGKVTVVVNPAANVNGSGAPAGTVTSRQNVVRLVVRDRQATAVRLNGSTLTQHATQSAFDAASSGWYNAGDNLILAKSSSLSVSTTKTFEFDTQPVAAETSVNFVCDQGFTQFGESIYAVGNIPALGNWNPAQAVKLSPSIYYEYIYNPPANHNGPGPSAPIWTGVIKDLPASTSFQWKCIRKRDDGTGTVTWEPGGNNVHTTAGSGYSGRTYGSF